MVSAPGPRRQPHGRLVSCPGGYRAFVPAPLPPSLTWDEGLTVSLSSADRAIGRLAGEGRRLPNPHLLIRPFVRKEAVLSSRIEGTQATLGELLAAEAGAAVERSPADLREVGNYVVALEYALERLHTLPMSLRLVREMHERLMRGVRGDVSAPGEFRRSQNWIGPPGCTLNDAKYVPPPPSELTTCLDVWERFLYDDGLPPLVHAALVHSQFEGDSPVSRRKWPGWTPTHHAAACQAGCHTPTCPPISRHAGSAWGDTELPGKEYKTSGRCLRTRPALNSCVSD